MKSNWTYRDLIDLEFFFHLDKGTDQHRLHKRDRSIYLEGIKPEEKSTRNSLYHWLQQRRNEVFTNEGGRSPGTLLQDSLTLLSITLLVIGLVIGLVSGLAFFSYSGTTPVNVFHFLFIFVFSQLVLFLVLLFSVILRIAGMQQLPSVIVQLYGTVISFFATHVARPVLEKLSVEKRYGYEQALGLIKKNRSSYGPLLYWPLFTLSQMVMVSLNIGLLTATLFRVITSDIAFGWQSTIQFTGAAIYKGVQILATPWSWLIAEQYGYPSLADIEGSHIILKDGIYHLATQNLISWWPFLLLCLLFYGLFLRLLLVPAGRYLQHRSMKGLNFNSPESLRVVQRMMTPLMSTQAPPVDPQAPVDQLVNDSNNLPGQRRAQVPPHALTLLIPADITALCQPNELISLLRQQGYIINQHEIIPGNYDSDQVILKKLGALDWQGDNGLLIIFEAWMVPINDSLFFLKSLRSAVSRHTPIYIGLIGRNQDAPILAPPTRNESNIWRRKLDGLGDPFLLVQEFYGADDT